MVWAIIKCVHLRALGSELLANSFVDAVDELFGEVALPDARLVGHYDHRHPGFVQLSYRGSGPREQPQTVNVVDVTHLF